MNANQINALRRPQQGQPFSTMDLLGATHPQYQPYPRKYDEPTRPMSDAGRVRMVCFFDEDDLNCSSFTGTTHAIERSQWMPPNARFFDIANKYLAAKTEKLKKLGHDEAAELHPESDAAALLAFSRACEDFGLRAQVYGCVSITATPVSLLQRTVKQVVAVQSQGSRQSRNTASEVHIVTLVPPRNYMGIETPSLRSQCDRFIKIEPLESRRSRKKVSKTLLYTAHFKAIKLWNEVENRPPVYCRLDRNGNISISKKARVEESEAEEAWNKVDEATRVQMGSANGFEKIDGANAWRMLDDMMQDTQSPYRHGLIMSNFTKTDKGKAEVRDAIMTKPCFKNG
jgi:hypothetical protein